MTAIKTIFAGGAALAALAIATPASAQYYPGYGGGGNVIGQVLGGIIGGGGYGSPYGYGYGSPYGGYGYGSPYGSGYGSPYGGYGSPYGGSSYGYGSPYGSGYGSPSGGQGNGSVNQYAVGVCMGAVQQRLDASYARSQYGGGARVLGVSDVEARSNGGTLVSGVANSGRAGAYAQPGGQSPVDLTFTCKTDRSGQVSSIEIGQAVANLGGQYNAPVPSPYGQDYSEYGYRRY